MLLISVYNYCYRCSPLQDPHQFAVDLRYDRFASGPCQWLFLYGILMYQHAISAWTLLSRRFQSSVARDSDGHRVATGALIFATTTLVFTAAAAVARAIIWRTTQPVTAIDILAIVGACPSAARGVARARARLMALASAGLCQGPCRSVRASAVSCDVVCH